MRWSPTPAPISRSKSACCRLQAPDEPARRRPHGRRPRRVSGVERRHRCGCAGSTSSAGCCMRPTCAARTCAASGSPSGSDRSPLRRRRLGRRARAFAVAVRRERRRAATRVRQSRASRNDPLQRRQVRSRRSLLVGNTRPRIPPAAGRVLPRRSPTWARGCVDTRRLHQQRPRVVARRHVHVLRRLLPAASTATPFDVATGIRSAVDEPSSTPPRIRRVTPTVRRSALDGRYWVAHVRRRLRAGRRGRRAHCSSGSRLPVQPPDVLRVRRQRPAHPVRHLRRRRAR